MRASTNVACVAERLNCCKFATGDGTDAIALVFKSSCVEDILNIGGQRSPRVLCLLGEHHLVC